MTEKTPNTSIFKKIGISISGNNIGEGTHFISKDNRMQLAP